jgi:hypothetical protein
VGFFGFGGGFGVGFGYGNVGWIPLAPFETFRPWYGRGWYGAGRPVIVNNVNIVRNVNVANEYRNARFSNAVTAVSAADFQRGNFRNPVGVTRAQLTQSAVVRGGVPIAPSASNMAFAHRPVAAVGPRQDVSSQRFFSRMTPAAGVAQRNSLTPQQSPARSAGAAGWQRFNGGQPGNGYGNQPRALQVAPPMVRQREAAPAYGGYNQGFRGGSPQPAPRQNYGAPSPGGQGGYRSAPPPSYRSAPAPAPRSNGGGGGGHSGGGGGHSGGHR